MLPLMYVNTVALNKKLRTLLLQCNFSNKNSGLYALLHNIKMLALHKFTPYILISLRTLNLNYNRNSFVMLRTIILLPHLGLLASRLWLNRLHLYSPS